MNSLEFSSDYEFQTKLVVITSRFFGRMSVLFEREVFHSWPEDETALCCVSSYDGKSGDTAM